MEPAKERLTRNEYVIWLASEPKRPRGASKELLFTEVFRTTNTANAYDVFLALSTVATVKQDSRYRTVIRMERSGIIVKEIRD